MYIGTRLVGSQGILVAIVIGLVAAADTGRFESAEDGEYIGVVDVCSSDLKTPCRYACEHEPTSLMPIRL